MPTPAGARHHVVYVHQSTPHQVASHRESADLQYQLRRRAVSLGWADDRVLVIRFIEVLETSRPRRWSTRPTREYLRRPRFLDAVRALAEEILKQPGVRKEIDGSRAVDPPGSAPERIRPRAGRP